MSSGYIAQVDGTVCPSVTLRVSISEKGSVRYKPDMGCTTVSGKVLTRLDTVL
jgi:hypothetical protein